MVSNTLFKLPELNDLINRSLETSVMQLGYQSIEPSFELQNNLKNNLETSLQNWSSNFKTANTNCPTCPNPPGYGFRVNFGLQILVDFKIRLKANLGIGYGQRYGDFAGVGALNASIYNHGLGTPVNGKDFVVDITAATYLTVGGSNGTPLTSYTLNYNSPSPILNDFKNSFTYGQLVTWNSALNEKRFSLADLQRQGMIGFRLGDFNVSSNNDTLYYGGDAGDKGPTGNISIVTPLFEAGFQDFTGKYWDEGNDKLTNDDEWRKFNEKNDINSSNFMHRQSNFQKSLNKASTYFRFNTSNGENLTIDFIGDAWLQNGIHRAIKDFRFDYNFKDTDIWIGKSW
ncbi:hypothetical protein [Flavobacterium sp. H122]|uniref:hypothetical protein n=1 Tax=Flavobacterium sp. H122 TaxID=2529860 RepID=UPI0010A9DE75|nr:hypothetical protein [Flavobacterium sp. H122]